MTTIQFNDPVIAQIVRQEGLENITNEVMEYIKSKFAKKNKSLLSNSLDQRIRALTVSNIPRADKLKNAMEELHTLIDDKDKKLSINEAKEQYFLSKANLL